MATRNVSLTEMLDAYIEDSVRSGAFQNASEVVRDALRLHKARADDEARKEARFKRLIQEGVDDLEAGRYVDVDLDDLDAYLEGLRAQVDEAEKSAG